MKELPNEIYEKALEDAFKGNKIKILRRDEQSVIFFVYVDPDILRIVSPTEFNLRFNLLTSKNDGDIIIEFEATHESLMKGINKCYAHLI